MDLNHKFENTDSHRDDDFKLIATRTMRTYRTYQIKIVEGEQNHKYVAGFEIWKRGERRMLCTLYSAHTLTNTLLDAAYKAVNQFRREEFTQ